MSALSQIRKAVGAGVGVLVTGTYTALQADSFQVAQLSQAQVSTVLFGALATGVAVFAVRNKKLAAIIGEVEHVAADAGGSAFTSLQPHLVTLQADLVAAIAPLAAGAHAKPEPTPNTPGV